MTLFCNFDIIIIEKLRKKQKNCNISIDFTYNIIEIEKNKKTFQKLLTKINKNDIIIIEKTKKGYNILNKKIEKS